jgi:AraC-like DNA-binding protein
MRWSTDELFTAMKEAHVIGRAESGCSEWVASGKVWRSGPGALQVKRPGDVHRLVSRDGPLTFQVVTIPDSMILSAVGKVRAAAYLDAVDERGAALHRLHDAVLGNAPCFELEVAIAEAMTALTTVVGAAFEHPRAVRCAIELLRSRLADPISLDDLAAHTGLDKFHLCRAFRAQVGLPPHTYLIQLRIARAKQLLAAGVKPSEIAPRIGMYDQSQLNRHFRRIVGTTPARYLRGL